jgi:cytochrome b
MKRILVWDIPIRLFHWLLAGSFVGAFAIANLVDDESALFSVHMLLGGTVAFMVLLRIVWGFVGSRYARFDSFSFSPGALLGYLKGAFTQGDKLHVGHNPATSLTAVAMFVLLVGLGVTGVLMSSGAEIVEEIHEVLAWGMVVLVGAHVAGIIWHTIRHKDNIALGMLDGRKRGEPSRKIRSAHPVVGVVFLVLTGLWSWGLVSNYDVPSGRLTVPITGQTLQVGEGEEHGEHEEHDDEDKDHDDDH